VSSLLNVILAVLQMIDNHQKFSNPTNKDKNMKSSWPTQKGSFKQDVVWFIWSRFVTKNTSGGVRERKL